MSGHTGGSGDGNVQVLLRRLGGTWKKNRRRGGREGGWLGGSADLLDGGGFQAIGEKRLVERRGNSDHVVAQWGGHIDDTLWRKWFCMSK